MKDETSKTSTFVFNLTNTKIGPSQPSVIDNNTAVPVLSGRSQSQNTTNPTLNMSVNSTYNSTVNNAPSDLVPTTPENHQTTQCAQENAKPNHAPTNQCQVKPEDKGKARPNHVPKQCHAISCNCQAKPEDKRKARPNHVPKQCHAISCNCQAKPEDKGKARPNHPPLPDLEFSNYIVLIVVVSLVFLTSYIVVFAIYLPYADETDDELCPEIKWKTTQGQGLVCHIALDVTWSPEMSVPYSKIFNITSCPVQKLMDSIFFPPKSKYTIITQLIEENEKTVAELYFSYVSEQNLMEDFNNGVSYVLGTKNNKVMLIFTKWSLDCSPKTTAIPTTTTEVPCRQPLPPRSVPAGSCGMTRTRSSVRIIGGAATDCRSQYPWIVLLVHNSNPLCGGSIWDSEHVLTAAHCFAGSGIPYNKTTGLASVAGLEIIAGKWEFNLTNRYNSFEQRIKIINAIVHTDYEGITNKADIALLKLDKPIIITDTSMSVCQPPAVITLPRTATVAGWGTTFEGRPAYPEKLQEVDVNVYDWNDCYTLFAPWFDDGDIARYLHSGSVICGANGLRGGKDSCQGDSGGPLFAKVGTQNYTVIGIVSHGYGCGRPGDPGFYTYVPFYLKWISDTSLQLG